MNTGFDDIADDYRATVEESISFIGVEHEYFVRRKAELLTSIIERHVGDPREVLVLDVGAGVGSSDRWLTSRVRGLVGCDPSVVSLSRAAAANPSADYAAASGTTLPFPTAAIDVAFVVNVLHHVQPVDRDRFIGEMARVVRPGGLVVAFEHNPLNPLTRRSVRSCPFDEGVELLGVRELRDRLRRAGLGEVERRYIVFTPFDVEWQHRIEDHLGLLPLGAQHYVVGRVA